MCVIHTSSFSNNYNTGGSFHGIKPVYQMTPRNIFENDLITINWNGSPIPLSFKLNHFDFSFQLIGMENLK